MNPVMIQTHTQYRQSITDHFQNLKKTGRISGAQDPYNLMNVDENQDRLAIRSRTKKPEFEEKQFSNETERPKRASRNGKYQGTQRISGRNSQRKQLSSLNELDERDAGILYSNRMLDMQLGNTESVIQIRKIYQQSDVNTVIGNRGCIGQEKSDNDERFETPPPGSSLNRLERGITVKQNEDQKSSSVSSSSLAILQIMDQQNSLAPDAIDIEILLAPPNEEEEQGPDSNNQRNRDGELTKHSTHLSQTLLPAATIRALALLRNNSQNTIDIPFMGTRRIILFYDKRSLFIFRIESCFRQFLIALIDTKTFEYVMVVIIMINSIILALYDYSDRDSTTHLNQVLDKLNMSITILFIVEACLKIIAKGLFMHHESYMRNGWNLIDLVVVISGILELSFDSIKLKALRVIRVFRPLKTINVIPSLRKQMAALVQSLPDFANVGTFLIYVFVLFATMGLHQYNGAFYNICRTDPQPESSEYWLYDSQVQRVCTITGLGFYQCPSGDTCGNNNQYPYVPLASDGIDQRPYINYGIATYNNIFSSFLTVWQIINSDTWNQQMLNVMDSDLPIFGFIFNVIMIVIGQFFLMNLILAVIIFAFIKTQKKELEEEILALPDDHLPVKGIPDPEQQLKKMPLLRVSGLEPITDNSDSFQSSLQNVDDTQIWREKPKYKPKHKKKKGMKSEANVSDFLKPQAQKRRIIGIFMDEKRDKSLTMDKNSIVLQSQLSKLSSANGQSEYVNERHLEESKFSGMISSQLQRGQISSDHFKEGDTLINPSSTTLLKQVQRTLRQTDTDRKDDLGLNQSMSFGGTPNYSQGIDSIVINGNTSSGKFSINKKEGLISNQGLGQVSKFPTIKSKFGEKKHQTSSMILREESKLEIQIQKSEGPQSDDDEPEIKRVEKGPTSFQKAFRKFIRKKIQKEFENKFKQILKEAKDSFQGENNDQHTQQSKMRELAQIRVGIEYMKQQQLEMKQAEVEEEIQERLNLRKIYLWSYKLLDNQAFQGFIGIAIILNTLVLSLDRYPQTISSIVILERVNIAFVIFFLLEIMIKLLALGFKNFFLTSGFNTFDSLVVIASLIDLFLSNLLAINSTQSDSGSVITALRAFRLLRVFKLAKQWKSFELLLETLGRTLVDIATFTILLSLFIYTFSLLGLELFAFKAKYDLALDIVDNENGVSPVYNFDTFFQSFTTLFIVLSNDNMSFIYYSYWRTVGPAISTIYFMMVVIVGQKILLNVFLAILLQNFDEGELKKSMHDYEEKQVKDNENTYYHIVVHKIKSILGTGFNRVEKWFKRKRSWKKEETIQSLNSACIGPFKITIEEIEERQKQALPVLEGYSFNLLSVKNRFRQYVYILVTHRYFDYTIIIVIIVSAIGLTLDSPNQDPNSSVRVAIYWIDLLTTTMFLLEAILKNFAFGFLFNGKWSYLKQPWNIIDFSIILISLLSMTPLPDSLRSFKVFRILRLLRLISHNEELKVAIRALFLAIPNVANVTIIMTLFFLIFGIIGVSYFKGKLFSCQSADSDLSDLVYSKWDCLSSGGEWINSQYNFDNVYNALIALFVCSTINGWSAFMTQCATATEIDYVAGSYVSPIWVIFFIVFIIVGGFFFLNLFVGVVISTFNSEHEKLGGNDLLTEKQREWIDLRLLVLRSAPSKRLQEPLSKWRQPFFRIINHRFFEKFILISIVLNSIVLMLKWYEQPRVMDQAAEVLNYIFTSIFMLEVIFKILGTNLKLYFGEGWNIFDFVIVVGSFIGIFIGQSNSLQIKATITVLRSFRVLRLMRLIRRGKSLQLIFNTFVITLHSLANIACLLLLFMFMYAILGMILFGETMRVGSMNDYVNFENFQNAFVTLFIVATGDNWNNIMPSFKTEYAILTQCIYNPSYQDYLDAGNSTVGCGSFNLAILYFMSYTFIVNLVFLKIFIAIILQGYEDTQIQDGRLFNHDMNDRFRLIWTEFDPDATTFISLKELRPFLFALGAPLGFDESFQERKFIQDKFIASLELPTYHQFSQYQFLDILDALSFRMMVLDHIQKSKEEEEIKKEGDGGQKVRHQLASAQLTMNREQEKETRDALQQEIYRLIFQKQSENISAVKEVSDQESKRLRAKLQNRDKCGLTSVHHMAAEATVRKMRDFLKRRKGIHVTSSYESSSSFRTDSSIHNMGSSSIANVSQIHIDNNINDDDLRDMEIIEEEDATARNLVQRPGIYARTLNNEAVQSMGKNLEGEKRQNRRTQSNNQLQQIQILYNIESNSAAPRMLLKKRKTQYQ